MTTIVKTLYVKMTSLLRNPLALMIICYTVVMSIATILKHHFFFTTAWDLGIFNQAFWSTVHGRFFYYTVEPWLGECFFSAHFSPILVLLVPFYAVYPSPETLLVLQSFIIALGAVPVYYLARDELGENFGLLFAVLYLTYPALIGANLFDFHVEAFAPVTILFTIYFLKKRNPKLFALSLILALMSLEYVGFMTILIALYAFTVEIKAKAQLKKIIPYVIFTICLSIAWIFISFTIRSIIRNPRTQTMDILIPVLNELGNPLQLLSYIFYDYSNKVLYLIMIFAPPLFTSLLSPYFLLTLPWLLFAFVSNYSPYYGIQFQYSLILIPFIFTSSIYGVKRLLQITNLKKEVFSKFLLFFALGFLVGSVTFLQPYLSSNFDAKAVEPIHRVISLIPSNASVLTLNNLFPHISNRFNAWVLPWSGFKGTGEPFPYFYTNISAIINEYEIKTLRENNPDFVLLDLGKEPESISLITSELLARRKYGVYASTAGVLLLKKDYKSDPLIYTPFNVKFNHADLFVHDGSAYADPTSEYHATLVHTTLDLDNVKFWTTPYIVMLPGQYNVTFRMKVAGNVQDVKIITLDAVTDKETKLLNSTVLYMSSFNKSNTWQVFALNFQVDELLKFVQIRGLGVSNKVDVYLDYIKVVQSSWKPNNMEG